MPPWPVSPYDLTTVIVVDHVFHLFPMGHPGIKNLALLACAETPEGELPKIFQLTRYAFFEAYVQFPAAIVVDHFFSQDGVPYERA